MHEVTCILSAIERGDTLAADALLPLVYDGLRRLAAEKMTHEKPGQTLEATALVHEAYIRLVDVQRAQHWDSSGHFFAAAAEAMRRILVERARYHKQSRGSIPWHYVPPEDGHGVAESPWDDLVALDEALARLEETDAVSAQVVKLRYFAGLKMAEAARALGISVRSAQRRWIFARTWLHRELFGPGANAP